jgi:hypothetical protein
MDILLIVHEIQVHIVRLSILHGAKSATIADTDDLLDKISYRFDVLIVRRKAFGLLHLPLPRTS